MDVRDEALMALLHFKSHLSIVLLLDSPVGRQVKLISPLNDSFHCATLHPIKMYYLPSVERSTLPCLGHLKMGRQLRCVYGVPGEDEA